MKRLGAVVFVLAVLLSLPLITLAQSTNATLMGRVLDPAKSSVPGASVEATNVDTNVGYKGTTDSEGRFSIPNLPPGNYRISVAKPGFKSLVKPDVVLHVQDVIALNFDLSLGSVSEVVTVEGGAPLINTESAALSTVVAREQIDNIPLNGRSLQALMSSVPGVSVVPTPFGGAGASGEISVNGQRTEANYFTVDGVSANTGVNPTFTTGAGLSGNVPNETALGTTQSLVSLDALQEFRIATSTYSAELGRTPGGQFSLLTRSGTNQWHGSLSEYFRNDYLDANNWFNNQARLPRTAERQNDFGGTLGGPIRIPDLYNGRDKTFFFFSYEGLRLRVPQAGVVTQVPDQALRQQAPSTLQPALDAFPVPNGAEVIGSNNQPLGLAFYTAAYSAPSSLDAASARIDHSVGKNLRLFARYSQSPSTSLSRSTQNLANLQILDFDPRSLTFGTTSPISSRLSNEARFNYSWNNSKSKGELDKFGGAVPADMAKAFGITAPPASSQFIFFLLFGSSPSIDVFPLITKQRQLNFVDTMSVSVHSHFLTMGVDYRRLPTEIQENQLLQQILFSSKSQVLNNLAGSGTTQTLGLSTSEPVFMNLSLFVQDEWRITTHLGLSLGLRWDVNPPPSDANGIPLYTATQITNLATTQVAPKGTPLWATTYHNFAPRLGIAYRLRGDRDYATVLRIGAGLFYDTGNQTAVGGIFGLGRAATATFTNVGLPFTPVQNTVPAVTVNPPYVASLFAFDPHLELPYALHWNVTLDQGLGAQQAVSMSYVGSHGDRLLMQHSYRPARLGNPNFTATGQLFVTTNQASSDYDAFQLKLQRRLAQGLGLIASYSWSRSIDNASVAFRSFTGAIRGNSDFDIRHNFELASTYDIPSHYSSRVLRVFFTRWGIDSRISARSSLPVEITNGTTFLGDGSQENVIPNEVPGVPTYLHQPGVPGGRIVNFSAFSAPAAGEFGNEPRNSIRGFDSWQIDLAVRRQFRLTEKASLQLRCEAFNLLNHPNFGGLFSNLSVGPALFGQAQNTLNSLLGGISPLFQTGGPRSLQLALRLQF